MLKQLNPEPDYFGKGPHFLKCVYSCFLFGMLYTPFMCIQNILTTIQEEAGFGSFGNTLIAIMYCF